MACAQPANLPMLHRIIIPWTVDIPRGEILGRAHHLEQPPCAGLDADAGPDLADGSGLFVDLPVDER